MTSRCTKNYGCLFIALCYVMLVSACSSADITPGTEVHAHVTHLPPAATVTTTAAGKQFVNNQGVTIELSSAYLVLSEMDLRTDCTASPFARLLDSLYELVLPAAHAHTESTPTKLGTPLVVNVINPDSEELEFGHFSPAAGSYCGITVHMHPADVDARGLPTMSDMIGKVLHVEGTYDDTVVAGTFNVDIAIEPEHADVAFHETIDLSASNLSGDAHLNIEYNTWFNDFDAATIAALDAGDATAVSLLLDNLTASIRHD